MDKMVEVVSLKNGEVVRRIGPMSPAKADKVEMGLLRQIDDDKFYTRVVWAKVPAKTT